MVALFISCYRWNYDIKGLIQDPVFHSSIFYEKFHPEPLVYLESGVISMDYIDMVDLEMKTREFITNNYPNSTIITSFRIFNPLELQVNIGYTDWSKYNITALPLTKENISRGDLVVYESNFFISDDVLELLSKMTQVKRFENNRMYITIYKA